MQHEEGTGSWNQSKLLNTGAYILRKRNLFKLFADTRCSERQRLFQSWLLPFCSTYPKLFEASLSLLWNNSVSWHSCFKPYVLQWLVIFSVFDSGTETIQKISSSTLKWKQCPENRNSQFCNTLIFFPEIVSQVSSKVSTCKRWEPRETIKIFSKIQSYQLSTMSPKRKTMDDWCVWAKKNFKSSFHKMLFLDLVLNTARTNRDTVSTAQALITIYSQKYSQHMTCTRTLVLKTFHQETSWNVPFKASKRFCWENGWKRSVKTLFYDFPPLSYDTRRFLHKYAPIAATRPHHTNSIDTELQKGALSGTFSDQNVKQLQESEA